VTARRRPLVAGAALVAAYVVMALLTPRLTGRPSRPLFDGFAPPAAYNWVKPPPGVQDDTSLPADATQDVAIDAGGSTASNAATSDGQAIAGLDTASVPVHPPDTSVQLHVAPFAAAALGALPTGMRAEGNAYRVTLSYRPSGQAITTLAKPGTIALTSAAPATALLFSPDGTQWQDTQAKPFGDGNGLFATMAAPGYYITASTNPARTAGTSGGGGGGAGGIVVVVLIVAVLLIAGGLLLGRGSFLRGGKGGNGGGKGKNRGKGKGGGRR
jgi:hypothetical protein